MRSAWAWTRWLAWFAWAVIIPLIGAVYAVWLLGGWLIPLLWRAI